MRGEVEAKMQNVIHIITRYLFKKIKNKRKLITFLHPSTFLIDFNKFQFKSGKKNVFFLFSFKILNAFFFFSFSTCVFKILTTCFTLQSNYEISLDAYRGYGCGF